MRRLFTSAALAGGVASAAFAFTATPAHADLLPGARHAVFVQTNDPTGNSVRVFDRADDGTLHAAGLYNTGGLGGTEADAPVDALASQSSLVYDADHRLLLAVNAGSNTVTVFAVAGDRLVRLQVIGSGGAFPTSIAVHGSTAYVLNAGGDGAVAGFRLTPLGLVPLPGSVRSLGLGNATPPEFIDAPAQAAISPDGRHLVVTTKSHGTILAFALDRTGRIASGPKASPAANPVPFAAVFTRGGDLVVTEAGNSSLTDYRFAADGSLTARGSVSDGQSALCWVQPVGGYFYGTNTGSGSVSAFTVAADGKVALVNATAAETGAGPIDMAESGGYLYVQNSGVGTVTGYRVNPDSSLTLVTTVTGLPAFNGHGMEGIAAS